VSTIRPELLQKLAWETTKDPTLLHALRAAPKQTLRTLQSLSKAEVRELGTCCVADAVERHARRSGDPRFPSPPEVGPGFDRKSQCEIFPGGAVQVNVRSFDVGYYGIATDGPGCALPQGAVPYYVFQPMAVPPPPTILFSPINNGVGPAAAMFFTAIVFVPPMGPPGRLFSGSVAVIPQSGYWTVVKPASVFGAAQINVVFNIKVVVDLYYPNVPSTPLIFLATLLGNGTLTQNSALELNSMLICPPLMASNLLSGNYLISASLEMVGSPVQLVPCKSVAPNNPQQPQQTGGVQIPSGVCVGPGKGFFQSVKAGAVSPDQPGQGVSKGYPSGPLCGPYSGSGVG
jgi:hypothetical protein